MNTNDYIYDVCDFLDIDFPKIEYVKDFCTPTMLAMIEYQDGQATLQVKSDFQNPMDLYFAIAHELRHLWQIETGLFDFSSYKSANEIDIMGYNMQPEEIDANAFSKLWLIHKFKMEPLFSGMPETVKTAIDNRYKELIEMYTI